MGTAVRLISADAVEAVIDVAPRLCSSPCSCNNKWKTWPEEFLRNINNGSTVRMEERPKTIRPLAAISVPAAVDDGIWDS